MAKCCRNKSGKIAEFAPALFVLLLLTILPLLDLLALGTGAATAYLMATQAASQAAKQQTFSTALASAVQESAIFCNSGFASFAKLVPIGGYQKCGIDICVVASSFRDSEVRTFYNNIPATPPIDPSTYIYEYESKVTCDVGPWIVLSGVPLINKVPGLGVPARLVLSSFRAAEFPQGVAEPSSVATNSSPQPPLGPPITQTTDEPPLPTTGWNIPDIYQKIAAAGETVVEVSVLQVNSVDTNWTNTGVSVASNEHVWFDSHADGLWTNSTSTYISDANGLSWDPTTPPNIYPQFNDQALLGKIGNGGVFLVGKDYMNYSPGGQSGAIYMMNNWVAGCGGGTGSQTVRIIVTE